MNIPREDFDSKLPEIKKNFLNDFCNNLWGVGQPILLALGLVALIEDCRETFNPADTVDVAYDNSVSTVCQELNELIIRECTAEVSDSTE
jgi:hypothetical protein